MSKQSNFLPTSISGALKSLGTKLCGFLLLVIGVVFIVALLFHNPYLDGFASASTFGNQGIVGNIVGFCRYSVGFVPSLFLFLCLSRFGFVLISGNNKTQRQNIICCAGSLRFVLVVLGSV